MEATDPRIAALTRAVVGLVADASRGLARSLDLNRVTLLRLAVTEPGIAPGEVARRLGLPASSVTRHAQALEEAGHVELRRNPDDRRGAGISATPAGVAELAALDEVGAEIFGGVVQDWSDRDIERLTALLDKLTTAWARHGELHKQKRRRVSRWQRDHPEDNE